MPQMKGYWLLVTIFFVADFQSLVSGQGCTAVSNCAICSSPPGCQTCNIGYVWDGTTCAKCGTGCAQCNITYCTVCNNGPIRLGPDLSNPAVCGECTGNCADCYTAGAGKCNLCQPGYGPAAGGSCGSCAPNCMTCYNTGQLTCDPMQCMPGFVSNPAANRPGDTYCIASSTTLASPITTPPPSTYVPPQVSTAVTIVQSSPSQENPATSIPTVSIVPAATNIITGPTGTIVPGNTMSSAIAESTISGVATGTIGTGSTPSLVTPGSVGTGATAGPVTTGIVTTQTNAGTGSAISNGATPTPGTAGLAGTGTTAPGVSSGLESTGLAISGGPTITNGVGLTGIVTTLPQVTLGKDISSFPGNDTSTGTTKPLTTTGFAMIILPIVFGIAGLFILSFLLYCIVSRIGLFSRGVTTVSSVATRSPYWIAPKLRVLRRQPAPMYRFI